MMIRLQNISINIYLFRGRNKYIKEDTDLNDKTILIGKGRKRCN